MAKAISDLRVRLELTQYAFANRLGTRERNVQRWESGEVLPGADMLVKLLQMCPDSISLRAFGIDCSRVPEPGSEKTDKLAGAPPVLRKKRAGARSK
jgi:transcriptional regulator with XRE-family HTH domain